MNTPSRLHYFICLFLIFSFSIQAVNDFQHRKDSITRHINTLQGEEKLDAYQQLFDLIETDTITDASMKEYLKISDVFTAEAQKQGNAKECGRNMINRTVFLSNNKRWKELDERKKEYLDYTSKNELWNYYYAIQSVYLENYYLKTGQTDRVIREVNELYEKAKEKKHKAGIMTSRFVMARTLNSQRRYAEAETYFEEGLKAYSKEKITPSYLDGWNNYCALLVDTRQWEKALTAIQQYDELTQQFLNEIGRGYPYLEAAILRLYAHAYSGTNQLAKAKAALNKADSLSGDLIGLTNSNSIRAEIAEKQGRYTEALAYLAKIKELRSGKNDYIDVTVLQTKASIWAKIEKAKNTLLWSEKAFELADSLSQNEYNKQLDELRTVYEVDKLTEEKEKIHQRWIAASLLSLLLIILLVVIIFYSRRMKLKNQAHYLQIKELTQMEKTVEECILSTPKENLSKEMVLFRRLSQVMQTEKLFIDPELTRKKLADRIGTNESYLAEAIKQASCGTFSCYLSNLRLQYAIELLTNDHDITLDVVAIDSGHGSYSTFYRSFSKKYGITPSEFRKLSLVTPH